MQGRFCSAYSLIAPLHLPPPCEGIAMNSLLNNLSIRARMSLSVLLFLITLGLAMYSARTAIGANIDFAVMEKYGNEYQRPLAKILDTTAKLRLELTKTQLNQGKKETLAELATIITTTMGNLKSIQDEIGETLQFTDDGLKSRGREALKFETVQEKWKNLSQKANSAAQAKLDADVASFIADIRGMIAHSGDTSNLILDPDLDSYYLMDMTLLALPQTIDRLSVIASTIYPQLASGYEMTQAEKTEAAVMARMLAESDVARLKADMDTSLKEDPNFYGTSDSFQTKGKMWIEEYETKNNALVEMLQKISSGEKVSQETFVSTLLAAQASAHTFLSEGYDELDVLLDKRIASYAGDQQRSLLVSIAGILISLLFFFIVVRTVTAPLDELTDSMDRLASNQLDTQIGYTQAKSEIGKMARAIQVFKDNAMKIIQLKEEQVVHDKRAQDEKKKLIKDLAETFEASVGGIVQSVSATSTELQSSAESLSSTSNQTTKQATHVASASEQTALSVQVVASAAQELTSSIGEISRQVNESTGLISGAVKQIYKTNETVRSLAESSSKIGEVVNLINDIASQTNLLALNATIEAARAGDAGKGFAVVASEVKNLAGQTAKATEEITNSISTMQQVTDSAVTAMQEIAKIVETINAVSNNIVAAVTQQSSATQEIAKNIQHVSDNTAEVSNNIQNVTFAAQESMNGSAQVLSAAGELSRQSERLRTEVSQFLSRIKVS